nr:protein TPX2-like isoform X2 [Ipomoea batatas]
MEESISIEEELLHDDEPTSSPEIDKIYEFDASQFFDFTRPESPSETERAERWFQDAGYYPPSPFFFKLNLKNIIPIEEAKESPMSKHCTSSSNHKMMKASGRTYNDQRVEDTPKAKSKSTTKSSKPRSSSTLMKPTASQLAKQNHAGLLHDNQATKRQKLESGYVRKVADLKHQTSLLHKSSKLGGLSPAAKTIHSRLNVTVPREPHLETRRRAQWRRFKSKNDLGSSDQHVTEKPIAFKARAMNKNILESPSTPQNKKSTPRSPASHESKVSNDGKLLQHPPIELFSQLSLKSDLETSAVSQPKHHQY